MLLAGCQSYQTHPLRPAEHSAAWQERTADGETLKLFASRLASVDSVPTSYSIADGLNLEEAQLVALIFNADLRLERLKAGIAEATKTNAGLWKDPQLNVSVLRLTDSVPSPWIVNPSLSFTIPISGRLEVAKQRADVAHKLALLRVAELEWNLRFELQQAWLNWSASKLKLEASELTVALLQSIIALQKALLESGEVFDTDVTVLATEETTQRAEIARVRSDLVREKYQLKELLGLSPDSAVYLVPQMTTPTTAHAQDLIQCNLTLQRLSAEYDVAELNLLREIRGQYPDLVLGPQYEADGSDASFGAVGGLRIPLLNRNKGRIAQADAARDLARGVYEVELERLLGQMATSKVQQQTIADQRVIIEKELIPMVDHQLERARLLMEFGESGTRLLRDSVLSAHQAKLRLIQLQIEESQINNEISRLLGPTDQLHKLGAINR